MAFGNIIRKRLLEKAFTKGCWTMHLAKAFGKGYRTMHSVKAFGKKALGPCI